MAYDTTPLITWAEYCAITGTLVTSVNQTLIETYLIPGIGQAIRLYCDRDFTDLQYQEWLQAVDGQLQPLNYPVRKLYAVQAAQTVLSVDNIGTPLTLSVNDEGVDIWDPGLGQGDSYELATFPDLATLIAGIQAGYAQLTFTLGVSGAYSTGLLAPGTYPVNTSASLLGAGQVVPSGIQDHMIALAGQPGPYIYPGAGFEPLACQWNPVYCCSYQAGYNPIPMDLKVLVARAVQDLLDQVQGTGGDPAMQSESVSQYSYTRRPNLDYNALINTVYSAALMQYRRAVWA